MIKNSLMAILVILFSANIVLAVEQIELPKPGLTPENPFYFLDSWAEKISLFFTFGAEKKAQKAKLFAEEKLAEAKILAEQKKTAKIPKALKKYEKYLDYAIKEAKEAKEQGNNTEEILAIVSEATQKHLMVLAEVYDKVPQEKEHHIYYTSPFPSTQPYFHSYIQTKD